MEGERGGVWCSFDMILMTKSKRRWLTEANQLLWQDNREMGHVACCFYMVSPLGSLVGDESVRGKSHLNAIGIHAKTLGKSGETVGNQAVVASAVVTALHADRLNAIGR